MTCVVACFAIFSQQSAAVATDSLRHRISLLPGDSSRVALLLETAREKQEDSLIVVWSLGEALALAAKNKWPEREAAAALELGKFYEKKYRKDSTRVYAERALWLFQEAGNKRGEAEAKMLLANVFAIEDRRTDALSLLFECLAYYESVNDSLQTGKTLNSIANSQNYLGHHRDALLQYARALHLFEAMGDFKYQAIVVYNMALIYGEEGDRQKAISHFLRSARLDEKIGNTKGIAETYTTLGSTYDDLQAWDSAYYYYSRSLAMLDGYDDEHLLAYNYRQLNKHFNLSGEPERGLQLGLKALELGKKMGNVQQISNSSLNLSESYEAMGRYKEALKYFRQFQQLDDSVYNVQNSKIILDMQARYESEKKEKELALKQADIERQEAMLEEQAHVRNMLIAGLAVVLLAAGFIYRSERLKAKAYNQLSRVNQAVENQNKIIEAALKEKEALLREIHHRVKNNLQVISSILNMQSRSTSNPDMLSAIQEGQSRVKAMALIHQKLYQSEKLSGIDFREYAEELIEHLSSVFQGSSVNGIKRTITSSDIKLDIDLAIPIGLILNELISNAYKYAFNGLDGGEISVE